MSLLYQEGGDDGLLRVYRNTALQSLRTSAKLTDRLPLQPEQSAAATDGTHVISGLFRDHFQRFMQAFWLVDSQPVCVPRSHPVV